MGAVVAAWGWVAPGGLGAAAAGPIAAGAEAVTPGFAGSAFGANVAAVGAGVGALTAPESPATSGSEELPVPPLAAFAGAAASRGDASAAGLLSIDAEAAAGAALPCAGADVRPVAAREAWSSPLPASATNRGARLARSGAGLTGPSAKASKLGETRSAGSGSTWDSRPPLGRKNQSGSF